MDPSIAVGTVSKGAPLTIVPFGTTDSFLRSEPDYPIKVDAIFEHGSDFIRQDPDGKHLVCFLSSFPILFLFSLSFPFLHDCWNFWGLLRESFDFLECGKWSERENKIKS